MADVAEAEDADHPLALVDHRQPARTLQRSPCDASPLRGHRPPGSNGCLPSSHRAPSRGVASKPLRASPLQTMSRSVTIPTRWSSSPIGTQPMSCARISLASSATGGVVGADPVDTLVHHVLDFHGGASVIGFQLVHCSTAAPCFHNHTTDRVRGRRRIPAPSPHPPEQLTATSRPGSRPPSESGVFKRI